MLKKEAKKICGTLSYTTKMPGASYSLSAWKCKTGSKLVGKSGSVCSGCYAQKNMYAKYRKSIEPAQERRRKSLTDSRWVEAMVTLIRGEKHFRWHDSGDFQSYEHLLKIVEVAQELPETKFYAPTKEYKLIRRFLAEGREFPKNLVIRVSSPMVGQAPLAEFDGMTCTVDFEGSPKIDCEAYKNKNQCGTCRACWVKEIPNINYKLH